MDAFLTKARISHMLLGRMIDKQITPLQLSKAVNIQLKRIRLLIDPFCTTLELDVFIAVCQHFNVRLRFTGTRHAKEDSSPVYPR